MTHASIDELLRMIRRASGLLQDDLTFQIIARPSCRMPQLSDRGWLLRPVSQQVNDARQCLKAFARAPSDDLSLTLAALYLSAALCRRGEQRKKSE